MTFDELPDVETLAREVDSRFLSIHKRGVSMPFSWEQLAPPRPGHTVVTSKSRWWLARRTVFVWLWSRVEAFGLRHDFLDYGVCYECAGTVEPSTHREDRKWVADA